MRDSVITAQQVHATMTGMRQNLALFKALFGLLALPAVAFGPVQRNWATSPAVVQIDSDADIYAVGDVHADYERLAHLLVAAHILADVPPSPERPEWTGGNSILIFTGDMIDKGPNALAVLALVRALPRAAAAARGRVVVLMGNHEAEFLAAPHSPKSAAFASELANAGMNPSEVAACTGDTGRFLCTLPFAARIDDWFFSHAGNTLGRSLVRLSADLESDIDHHGFAAQQLIDPNSLLEARIGEKGPSAQSWYEAGMPRVNPDALLSGYATAVHARHIVEGHHHGTANFPDGGYRGVGEMFQWHGLLFLIDTGMSREIDHSAGAVLHVQQNAQASAVCADGTETVIWDARLPEKTGKAAPCRPR